MENKAFLKIPKEKRQVRNKKNYFAKRKDIPESNFYTEISNTIRENKKFSLRENTTRFIFKNTEENSKKNFKKIIQYLTKKAIEKNEKNFKIEKISYDLYCEALNDPLIIPPRDMVQNNPDVVLESFYHIQQSFAEIDLLNEEITIIISTYSAPTGSGK